MTFTPTRPTAYAPVAVQTRGGTARAVTVILVTAICALLGVGQAHGAGTPEDELTWSVRPADNDQGTQRANYAYVVEPGTQIEDALVVTNASPQELTLAVYAADGYTTPSGHLDLQPGDVPPVDLGSWVTPEVDELVLAPGESREVPFTLTVPEDASPGDHPGGIVTSYVTGDGTGTVRLDRRLGSRIHVRVAGDMEVALTVTDVTVEQPVSLNPLSPEATTVRYTLTNTGNVRTLGHETVTVSGPAGLGAVEARVIVDELMPGNSLSREVVLDGVWPLVRLTAQVDVAPEAVAGEVAPVVGSSGTGWSVPWVQLAILLVLLVVAVWIGLRRASRPGATDTSAVEASEPAASTQ